VRAALSYLESGKREGSLEELTVMSISLNQFCKTQ